MVDQQNRLMRQAIRHYTSLFAFPDYRKIIALHFLVCLGGSLIAFVISSPSLNNICMGFAFGLFVLALPTVISDILTSLFITKRDTIFNLRRCAALSLVACCFWVAVLIAGSLLSLFSGVSLILVYAVLFGVGVTLSIRFLALNAISLLNPTKVALSTITQPLLCFISAISFWNLWDFRILLLTFSVSILFVVATYVFNFLVDQYGKRMIGIGTISLLKGFIVNWCENVPTLLEDHFEQLGIDESISVKLLGFREENHIIKSIMVVPALHPGPFRNIGSSNLPYIIQKFLEEKFRATVAVPHGTSGHEFDLTSKRQCEKILSEINYLADFSSFSSEATRLVRVEKGFAKATCQLFGDCALVTITYAPKSMEDVPYEIGCSIVEMGQKAGVKEVIVIDAHNSIEASDEDSGLSTEDLHSLQLAAEEAVALALKEPRTAFKIGVAKVVPKDFDARLGMGPSGIVTLTVGVGDQTVAYVIIDGNNMVSGLREKIILSLKTLGIDEGEVLTTDTHVVNALSIVKRGYHPIGEVIDQQKLIAYIRDAVVEALNNMQKAEASWKAGKAHNVRTIGEKRIVELSLLVDSAFRLSKKLSFVIYAPTILLSFFLFLL